MFMDTISPFGHLMPKVMMSFAGEGGGTGEGQGNEGQGGGVGDGATDWRATLPENIKSHPVLQKYKTPNDAISALVSVQDLIGADKIIIPSKDAKEEEWNERVWNRLGRPAKPEEYGLPTDLKIPEDLPIDEKLVGNFKSTAHKYGLLPHQVAGMYKWFLEEQIAGFENMKTMRKSARDEAETKLRREYGAAFGQNLALGKKVLGAFGDPEMVKFLDDNGLGNDPAFARFLTKVGQAMSEDQLQGKPKGLTLTPEEAMNEIKKMEADLKGPLYDLNHPEHKAVVEKRDTLYRMANPA